MTVTTTQHVACDWMALPKNPEERTGSTPGSYYFPSEPRVRLCRVGENSPAFRGFPTPRAPSCGRWARPDPFLNQGGAAGVFLDVNFLLRVADVAGE